MGNLGSGRFTMLAIVTLALLSACGGEPRLYVSPSGDELRFISDTQIQRTVGDRRVIEGTYEWERDPQGNVRWLLVDDDGLGELRFLPAENGCLMSDRVGGPWCPR